MEPGDRGPHSYTLIARMGGAVAGLLGLVTLLGWIADLPFLTTFRMAAIPMAPSTALLFLVFGAEVYLERRSLRARRAIAVRAAVIAFATAAALALLVLSSCGVDLDAEHPGLQPVDAVGGAPVGHMSPVTAFCFLLVGASTLAMFWAGGRKRVALTAFLAAFGVVLIATTLTIAYVLGGPLLYDSGMIPPALPTSLAFLALGASLAATSASRIRPPEPPSQVMAARTTFAFFLVFAFMATGIVTVGYVYFRGYQKRHRVEMEAQLAAVAAWKVSALTQWREERLADAAMFFDNPDFSGLVRRHLGAPDDPDALARLGTWLRIVEDSHRYDRVFLADIHGKSIESVPAERGPAPPPSLWTSRRRFARDGRSWSTSTGTRRTGPYTWRPWCRSRRPDGPWASSSCRSILRHTSGP